jgi:hypothetical protein
MGMVFLSNSNIGLSGKKVDEFDVFYIGNVRARENYVKNGSVIFYKWNTIHWPDFLEVE